MHWTPNPLAADIAIVDEKYKSPKFMCMPCWANWGDLDGDKDPAAWLAQRLDFARRADEVCAWKGVERNQMTRSMSSMAIRWDTFKPAMDFMNANGNRCACCKVIQPWDGEKALGTIVTKTAGTVVGLASTVTTFVCSECSNAWWRENKKKEPADGRTFTTNRRTKAGTLVQFPVD
ncbi:hypothetical protein M409DRAFT_18463 [Zasmidium cellare ATCC 36951]|uniref:Uncharacterized protein n=1 Tax=Zasmidium cellare ATCC 36951 TaxID=1080233 RepID=A0A6A6D121_ZASCE|nr:uncharacterized protein M409DRAFT_18463 [Zasmidium cellare ATCC 36951]KAF2171346.1 hypothetical protein M409DRAFT_18463 [Zasmidium cellare ATCC 36951]